MLVNEKMKQLPRYRQLNASTNIKKSIEIAIPNSQTTNFSHKSRISPLHQLNSTKTHIQENISVLTNSNLNNDLSSGILLSQPISPKRDENDIQFNNNSPMISSRPNKELNNILKNILGNHKPIKNYETVTSSQYTRFVKGITYLPELELSKRRQKSINDQNSFLKEHIANNIENSMNKIIYRLRKDTSNTPLPHIKLTKKPFKPYLRNLQPLQKTHDFSNQFKTLSPDISSILHSQTPLVQNVKISTKLSKPKKIIKGGNLMLAMRNFPRYYEKPKKRMLKITDFIHETIDVESRKINERIPELTFSNRNVNLQCDFEKNDEDLILEIDEKAKLYKNKTPCRFQQVIGMFTKLDNTIELVGSELSEFSKKLRVVKKTNKLNKRTTKYSNFN